ncbi:MAG TPA: pyrroline-5-carboxylate reductase [Patescibacteria group bacterium]|nr:pyrroline-5-carboxylate reductase [Patescibacteria group bacterium]
MKSAKKFTATRVAVLGAGKMGGILLGAFLEQKLFPAKNVFATVHHAERIEPLRKQFPVSVSTDNAAAVRQADVVLICVKPQAVREVLDEIRGELTPNKLVISIAASVPIASIEKLAGDRIPVVRAMPNTPSVVRRGMTVLAKGAFASESHLAAAEALFQSVGRTLVLDEKHMDAVTGLSASGPAFIYVILESLAEGGVKVGLPRDVATMLAAQTALGAATVVLETGSHPAMLKDAVTTPAGCTIDGLLELEDGRLRVTLIKAVVKAVERAKQLWFEP